MFIRSGYRAHTRSSATERHHHAAHVIVGGRDDPGGPGLQPVPGPFGLQRAGADPVERDAVKRGAVLALARVHRAPALEHELAPVAANGHRMAGKGLSATAEYLGFERRLLGALERSDVLD